MRILLIRHGQTKGNSEKRYVGRIDEPLWEAGRQQLREYVQQGKYPEITKLFVSPLGRTMETAQIIFAKQMESGQYEVVDGIREMDFGKYEGKNFKELSDDPEYQAYLDAGGNADFPSGEGMEEFSKRCLCAFEEIVKSCDENDTVAIVTHGGTIMSLLDALGPDDRGYYDWFVGNGDFYDCSYIQGALCLRDES